MFVSFANKQVNDYPCDSKVVKSVNGKEKKESSLKKSKKVEEVTKCGSRQKVYRNMAFNGSSNSITDVTQAGQKVQQQLKGHKLQLQPSPLHPRLMVPMPHHPHYPPPPQHPYYAHHFNNKSSRNPPSHAKELKLVRTTKF